MKTQFKGVQRNRHFFKNEYVWICLILGVFATAYYWSRLEDFSERMVHQEPRAMLFVGDVMLARNVENLMERHGAYYPFTGIRSLFDEHDIVVGNFEAAIPERHVKTPSMSLTFSVKREYAEVLARVGFTDLSLANNHAYDHGASAYTYTKNIFNKQSITARGNPNGVFEDEIIYRDLDGLVVAIIPINATYRMPTVEGLRSLIESTGDTSDMQIVYIHWGDEYELRANDAQRTLAHGLVDVGIDAVIGHHPHVVQDVEIYRGAPIFYSLGNFIFDQYWNDDVRTGLAVSLIRDGTYMKYTLIPVSSIETRSVPVVMERVPRVAFLADLANRGEEKDAEMIRTGILTQLVEALSSK